MAGVLNRLAFIASVLPQDAISLSYGRHRLSYPAMLDAVRQRADWLESLKSRRVAFHSGNTIEWVLFDLACQELNIVFIPLPTFFSAAQVQHCIAQSGADVVLCDHPNVSLMIDGKLEPIKGSQVVDLTSALYVWAQAENEKPNRSSDQLPIGTQKVTFTSGSTGNPKGVCLSMEHQWLVAQSLADAIGIQRPKHLCLLPLSTLLENIAGVYTPLLCGGEVAIVDEESRGFLGSSEVDLEILLGCINRAQPNSLILIPELLRLLVHAFSIGWKVPTSLQFIAVGGGKVSPELIEYARELGLPVYQGYGLSECGSVVALNTPTVDKVSAVGQVLPHTKVSIKEGEIVVSGQVHLGYMGDVSSWYPEKVLTGDIGALEDGYLSIEGRKKNILITSFGRNVSPEWVESTLMSKPLLKDCVVLGDGKPYLVALVSAHVQVSNRDIQKWINICNESLPDYARLGDWLRVPREDLKPYMTANGRPQRQIINTIYEERLNRMYKNDDSPRQYNTED